MPMLLCSQQIARPADFQIPHGNFKAAAQIGKFPNCLQALFRHLFQHLIPAVHEESIGRPAGTPHSPPQLIKLGKPHIVRIMDNHGVYVGNIQPGLYNGG